VTRAIVLTAALTACCGKSFSDVGGTAFDAGQGGQAGGCVTQSDCAVGDGLHDICYEHKAMPLRLCVDAETIPCAEHYQCGPFGWCDSDAGHCAAEGAAACLVAGELRDCQALGEHCCEFESGEHGCAGECSGTVLEP
jgi:hypothetical protein